MDFLAQKASFDTYMGVKSEPNEQEKLLFLRAQKYIQKISAFPGIRMIAVVNSLSMCATHESSDIDLFIIAGKNRMWIVRVLVTLTFWWYGVWRKGEDIAGNFCLSFFVEEDALDFSRIALEDDIYLYFWIYHLKPIYIDGNSYEDFLYANPWVDLSQDIRAKNSQYLLASSKVGQVEFFLKSKILTWINQIFGYFGERKARSTFEKMGFPSGVIITSGMLKFHDADRRETIRNALMHHGR